MELATKEHKFVSVWQKLMSNKKNIAKKSLPVLLAVALLAAVGFFAFGNSKNLGGWVSGNATSEAEKQALAQSKLELEQALAQTQELLNQITATNQNMQTLLDQAIQEKNALYDAIEEMQTAYDEAEQEALQKWIVPIDYLNVSSYFGYRLQPTDGASSFHSGVDLAAPQGTPIVATRGGTVTIATYDSYSGYYVCINHHDGFVSQYLHMARYIVTPGQVVIAGQVIGYCGSTGVSTGAHLHFGILLNGQSVNPAKYIDM